METIYRLLLYNIRYCTGVGWKFHAPIPFSGYLRKTIKHVPLIIDFINFYNPDIIGLIEVDGGSIRSEGINQAEQIADGIGHDFIFEKKYTKPLFAKHIPIIRNQGNAFLANKEIQNQKCHYFDSGIKRLILEIEFENVVFFLVHLSISFRHRQKQLNELSLLVKSVNKPIIVVGDFNIFFGHRELENFLESTKLKSANTFNDFTFPSKKPRWELDFVFHSPDIEIHKTNVPKIRLSDHLPLVCDFTLKDYEK